MTENSSPTLEEWRRLYEAASRLKEVAPWDWLMEADIFGVQNPETGELGFVSVMGARGEHFAVALYLGSAGLYGFWALESAGDSLPPETVLEIPQLQAAFNDRELLHKQDREVLKQLGLKFRGRNAWPQFRSYRPGFFPWFLTAAEARFLTAALEQTPEMARRIEADRSLLRPGGKYEFLVRVPRPTNGDLSWEDQIKYVPPPEVDIKLEMNLPALDNLRHLPRSDREIEMDLFLLPTPVREGKERPFFPYMLLTVDAESGMVLDTELLNPLPSLEALWGSVPLNVVYQLTVVGFIPRLIRVRSDLLFQLLQTLAAELQFRVKRSARLRNLDPAKEFLIERFE
jgi:hypothetical protein